MRKVILLGSTGSIGTQTLEVVEQYKNKYEVLALSAGSNIELLYAQTITFKPEFVGIADEKAAEKFKNLFTGTDYKPQIFSGKNAATIIAGLDSQAIVVNGITGAIGLRPTIVALENGSRLALANKESLVIGGALVKQSQKIPGQIVPVDSEHSAIAQCLMGGKHNKGMCALQVDGTSEVDHIILTASGGPFRGYDRVQLEKVTAKDALKHPTWNMGNVVTINSSTLMNKGLELIEAHLLFDIAPEKIHPVVHPQSIIHSMVAFKDGSILAQASPPNMKLPIVLGLSWPERLENILPTVDFSLTQSWDFMPVDNEAFPALELAKQSINASNTHPCVMNASNEICVELFLNNKIGFLDIIDTVTKVLDSYSPISNVNIDSLEQVDSWAREKTKEILGVS